MNWKSFVSLVYVIYTLLLIHCFIHLNRWESVLEKSARLWKKMPLGQSCITMMVPNSVLSSQSQRYIEYPWFSSSSSFFFIFMSFWWIMLHHPMLLLYWGYITAIFLFYFKKKKKTVIFSNTYGLLIGWYWITDGHKFLFCDFADPGSIRPLRTSRLCSISMM